MRHDRIERSETFDVLDVAEVWPEPGAVGSSALAEIEAAVDQRPCSAVPDVPLGVGLMIAASYAGIIVAFALTLATGLEATFMIVVSALYVSIFFAVPSIFLLVEKDGCARPTLASFMENGIDTLTGRMTGASALVQILLVPVLLALCILAMGVTALLLL